jgi:hypothetical protein
MLASFELDPFELSQLAYRASNLAERLCLLKRLGELPLKVQHLLPLNLTVLAQVNQALNLLFPAASVDRPQDTVQRLKRQAIKRALRHYSWYGLNLQRLTPAHRQVFTQAQAPWLTTYQKAMTCFGQQADSQLTPECQQGYAPFYALLEQKCAALLAAVRQGAPHLDIQLQAATAVQQHLGDLVHPMIRAAITAAPGLSQALQTRSPEPAVRLQLYHRFYLQFPVLARWLAQLSSDLVELLRNAITHVVRDCSDLSQKLWDGVSVTGLEQVQFLAVPNAAETQGILYFSLRLANGQLKQLLYYPYALDSEQGLQRFYTALLGEQTAQNPFGRVLCRTGYGYLEISGEASNSNLQAAFQQLGQYLAFRQLLGHRRGLLSCLQIGIDPSSFLPRQEFVSAMTPLSIALNNGDSPAAIVHQSIQQGFEAIDDGLRLSPQKAIQALDNCFAGTTARLCHRPLSVYLQLLHLVQTATCLENPLQVDAVFRTLVERPCPWDGLGEIAQLEVKLLWQFKVPWQTVPMNYRYLLYDNDHALFSKLPLSPLLYLKRRVGRVITHPLLPPLSTEAKQQPPPLQLASALASVPD